MNEPAQVCVIGWPIHHSRSPLIHNYWLRQYGIDARYEKRAVAPEDLPEFLARFAEQGLIGANVTIPHKETVFRSVTVEDRFSNSLQAVNTLYLQDGRLMGTNTDGYGFLANLKQAVPDLSLHGANVAILGAGGAARAVVGALLEEGVKSIALANRSMQRAEDVASQFGTTVRVVPWDSREDMLDGCDLLVNTTSLGMTGKDPLAFSFEGATEALVVCDIVYVPLMTPLLTEAATRGLRIVDGLGMLLHQAVPAFERWFGVRPQVTPALRALVIADLQG
ncbi:shikimate dehydrogenase [Rhodoligotrophos appendicifer]|uniref:shikimate dehydrogenase n=1 Tax=Rhodoligotrophos appendicifer TaxID=987056 RepID=UPI00117F5A6E|nr:shikimate dehydrogenase [Rhodoligotrophos appendicifer]